MSGLLSLLEENAALLSERVYTEMIEDPFWLERYGERAAVHMRQDSVFHLQYLREAIATAHPEVMENYARWLQTLLTARGMCTLHIAENFDRLRKAIVAQQWGVDLQLVGTLLEAATTALRYPPGPASNLQALSPASREVDHLASYLADAVFAAAPERFVDHVTWLRGFHERHGLVAVDALLDQLGRITADIPEAEPAIAAARATRPA